ncbi:hypothetical protein V8C42DRAFT_210312 [Trichoderma barbatum]
MDKLVQEAALYELRTKKPSEQRQCTIDVSDILQKYEGGLEGKRRELLLEACFHYRGRLVPRFPRHGRRSVARRKRVSGKMEFMAIEVLLGTAHTYRHDLESFFMFLYGYVHAGDGHYRRHRICSPMKAGYYNGIQEATQISRRANWQIWIRTFLRVL